MSINLIGLIESFESYLDDCQSYKSVINVNDILYFDEQECLADEHLAFIKKWGYMDYLIPQHLGGKLTSLESLFFLTRCCAQRDLTTAVALGVTFLGSLPIWIAGSDALKKSHTQSLKQGKPCALALTEYHHGSDLSANEFFALEMEQGWLINGSKWCINYASLASLASVLVKTNQQGGPLGFSMLYLNKETCQGKISHLPKLATHGVRGLDISGFEFKDVRLPSDALIGKKGSGLATTFKTLQISRILCASFVLGGVDTALRHTIKFSLTRQLYNQTAFDMPVVKQRLAECFCYQLIQDALSLTVVRAATIASKGLANWSAIVKYFTPMLSEKILSDCAVILGARGYLRTDQHAIFQKIRRDAAVVGLFDGSSQVNLYLLTTNLIKLAKSRQNQVPKNCHESTIERIFKLGKEANCFTGEDISINTPDIDMIIAQLAKTNSSQLKPYKDKLLIELDKLDRRILQADKQNSFDPKSLFAFREAEKYCWIFAGCCLIQIYHYNEPDLSNYLVTTDWLALSIELIINHVNGDGISFDAAQYQRVIEIMLNYYNNHQLFSLLAISLGTQYDN